MFAEKPLLSWLFETHVASRRVTAHGDFRKMVSMAKKTKGKKSGAATAAVALLTETNTPFQMREYEHTEGVTSFGEEAAKNLGASEEQVFKTLLIVHEKEFAVAIVPVSGKLKVAERRTGYVVGGISPLGQKTPSPTLLDESAQLFDIIMVSGGKRGLDVELAPDDLLKLTNGKYADIRA